ENFLRCHVSLITLLERAAGLPGLAVDVYDEGEYGAWGDGDDRRPATHSAEALLRNLGQSEAMIAALFGALRDRMGAAVDSPILGRPDFEHLEARGASAAGGAFGRLADAIAAAAGAANA